MEVVAFHGVTKTFRTDRPWGLKDALLGSKGKRQVSRLVTAVDNVSFSVIEGESVALLGHNGSGKSTTLKLLAGTIVPSSGSVVTRGKIAPLLELGGGFHPDLSGRENVYLNASLLGVRRHYVKRHMDEILEFASLVEFADMPVRFYSSGMTARLGFSVAVHVQPEVLLLDEVLAVGDAGFQEKCLRRMQALRDEGRTMILVTHSWTQAEGFCDRAIVLSRGRLVFDGPVEESYGAFEHSSHLLDA